MGHEIISKVEGTANVETGLEDTDRETRIQVDKDRLCGKALL